MGVCRSTLSTLFNEQLYFANSTQYMPLVEWHLPGILLLDWRVNIGRQNLIRAKSASSVRRMRVHLNRRLQRRFQISERHTLPTKHLAPLSPEGSSCALGRGCG